jgi:hypothetical protein
MWDKNNQLPFPDIPHKERFVDFINSKIRIEDLPTSDTKDETQMRQELAEKIFDTFFISEVKDGKEHIKTIVMNWSHLLDDVKKTYPDLNTFINRVQSSTIRNLFWNNDIIEKANKAKKKGLENLAKILIQEKPDENTLKIEAKKFLRWDNGELETSVQTIGEAIEGAENIRDAIKLLDADFRETGEPDWEKLEDTFDIIKARQYIISLQKETLFDVLSKDMEIFADKMMRQSFLNYIWEHFSIKYVDYIQENFKLLLHENKEFSIQTFDKSYSQSFEDKYADIFIPFFKSIWRTFRRYVYIPKQVVKKDISQTITSTRKGVLKWRLNSNFNWENFVWDKLKTEITNDVINNNKNLSLVGGTWSGKTHLSQWLAKEIHNTKPNEDIIYMTWLEFYNQYQSTCAQDRAEKKKAEIENRTEDSEKPADSDDIQYNYDRWDERKTIGIKPQAQWEYKPSFTDQFINKIVFIDGIDPIFLKATRVKSQEAFLTALWNAKQFIISGNTSIVNLTIEGKKENIKVSTRLINTEERDMPTQHDKMKRAIIRNLIIEKENLFTQNLSKEGIENILIDHVEPADYKQILSWYLKYLYLNEWEDMNIKQYLEKKIEKKERGIFLPAEDILSTIYMIIRCEDDIRETAPWMKWLEVDKTDDVSQLLEKIRNGNVATDSDLWLFMEIIIYFIRKQHTELNDAEIGKIINKNSVWSIFRKAEERKHVYKKLFDGVEKWLTDALNKKYGLKPSIKK